MRAAVKSDIPERQKWDPCRIRAGRTSCPSVRTFRPLRLTHQHQHTCLETVLTLLCILPAAAHPSPLVRRGHGLLQLRAHLRAHLQAGHSGARRAHCASRTCPYARGYRPYVCMPADWQLCTLCASAPLRHTSCRAVSEVASIMQVLRLSLDFPAPTDVRHPHVVRLANDVPSLRNIAALRLTFAANSPHRSARILCLLEAITRTPARPCPRPSSPAAPPSSSMPCPVRHVLRVFHQSS